MPKEINARKVWMEYDRLRAACVSFGNDFFEVVKQNEDFFVGNQWKGAETGELDKPVINILKRVVLYAISQVVSDRITASVKDFGELDQNKEAIKMINAEIERVMENSKLASLSRDIVESAAVDGDACLHVYFDTRAGTADAPGEIKVERLENVDVFFGNAERWEVEKQPFIIIRHREMLEDAREEAITEGMPEAKAKELITSDDDKLNAVEDDNPDDGGKRVTVLLRYWRERETGTIWYSKSTQNAVLKEPTDTGYRLYPLAWMSWEHIKGNYHGQAMVTGAIANQKFVNKLFALAMHHVKTMAFPKIFYNESSFPGGWTNRVGAAIAITGNPSEAISTGFRAPEMSPQVIQLIDRIIDITRDTLGASDAALGNVRADNTSAIIAVQKASAAPLELQRQGYYALIEEIARIIVDIMRTDYGVRMVPGEKQVQAMDPATGMPTTSSVNALVPFDFAALEELDFSMNVDVGPATYWSELTQTATLENLLKSGVITPKQFLENLPAGYVPGRDEILREMEEQMAAQAQMQVAPSMPPAQPEMPTYPGAETMPRMPPERMGLQGLMEGMQNAELPAM
ncbi:MAG: hypothetical protein LBD02_10735 [Christensenellaceae bacterium]|jgi:hypothetical protein|nr:hypothetical protein [Christensenellaceae bacterium]